MTHAGMTPVSADATEFAAGQYRAKLNLAMAGDWYVLVHFKLADGRQLDQQFEIREVTPA